MPGYPLTALWINNPGFDTDHRHHGGMLTKTPPPTELQIPATVKTLNTRSESWCERNGVLHSQWPVDRDGWLELTKHWSKISLGPAVGRCNCVNHSSIAHQNNTQLFCVTLYLMNVAASTPPVTSKSRAATAAFCYAMLCIQLGHVLRHTFWTAFFALILRQTSNFANLQSLAGSQDHNFLWM